MFVNRRRALARWSVAALLLGAAAGASAQTSKPSDSYDELYQRYLADARAAKPAAPEAEAWGWLNGLTLDRRARNVNDLVTIHVVENIAGSGSADAALGKSGAAGIGLPSIFGLEKKLPSSIDPSSLVSANTKTDFKGTGTTNRAGTLTAQMTARVSDVLPSGDLVVEGVREIEINGDRQVVVLTGVVRSADVGPTNVVLSTDIGQLRIRYFGRGLMKDNLNPGWLVRILNKIF